MQLRILLRNVKKNIGVSVLLFHSVHGGQLSLSIDASDTCIGSVLQQTVNEVIQPLTFCPRKLTPAEQKYSTNNRQMLALYCSVKHFRHIIEVCNVARS